MNVSVCSTRRQRHDVVAAARVTVPSARPSVSACKRHGRSCRRHSRHHDARTVRFKFQFFFCFCKSLFCVSPPVATRPTFNQPPGNQYGAPSPSVGNQYGAPSPNQYGAPSPSAGNQYGAPSPSAGSLPPPVSGLPVICYCRLAGRRCHRTCLRRCTRQTLVPQPAHSANKTINVNYAVRCNVCECWRTWRI